MYLWFMSNPDLTYRLIAGREAHADALVRASYRIFGGVEAVLTWLGRLAEASVRAYGRWRRRRLAIRTLQGLDDRLLGDIGVARSDIRRIAEETAEHGPMTVPELAQMEAERHAKTPAAGELRLAA